MVEAFIFTSIFMFVSCILMLILFFFVNLIQGMFEKGYKVLPIAISFVALFLFMYIVVYISINLK